ncbi:MAG: hypothetical protein U5O39_19245 [Gammaproteobacteria bacterium]|nr:hypothetical protein [Gammaproteobacteria bacterium]
MIAVRQLPRIEEEDHASPDTASSSRLPSLPQWRQQEDDDDQWQLAKIVDKGQPLDVIVAEANTMNDVPSWRSATIATYTANFQLVSMRIENASSPSLMNALMMSAAKKG